jgi:hypothetical protein
MVSERPRPPKPVLGGDDSADLVSAEEGDKDGSGFRVQV